ncbi:MAG: hypothetical protein HQ580_01675 [Planctomycetes bacterium]|nr:hypothetical protein [Planctomycetota bacterium]
MMPMGGGVAFRLQGEVPLVVVGGLVVAGVLRLDLGQLSRGRLRLDR